MRWFERILPALIFLEMVAGSAGAPRALRVPRCDWMRGLLILHPSYAQVIVVLRRERFYPVGRRASAIVPVPGFPVRIRPVPAQVGMGTRWDVADGSNGNQRAEGDTRKDRAVVRPSHPWTAIPIRPTAPTPRTPPGRRSSPTRFSAPAGMCARPGSPTWPVPLPIAVVGSPILNELGLANLAQSKLPGGIN